MNQAAVLVTGASSGIGLAIVCELVSRGVPVIAGVRSPEAVAALHAMAPAAIPIGLDVTRAEHIEALPEALRAHSPAGLAAVVNNAGIAVVGPLECVAEADLRHQLEVNVVGQMAVTRALLPALRASRGRVVFMGSIAGRIASPFAGPYCASKFALRALADSLRVELADQGVRVILIEPGAFRSHIWARTGEGVRGLVRGIAPDSEPGRLYGPLLPGCLGMLADIEARAPAPAPVARAVWRALTAASPRSRYLVGRDAWFAALTLARLPDALRDSIHRWRLGRVRAAGTRGH
jgi:NAD(P)-dependent dehydrogenase (short-subunit alcohol dehydrogenase family)